MDLLSQLQSLGRAVEERVTASDYRKSRHAPGLKRTHGIVLGRYKRVLTTEWQDVRQIAAKMHRCTGSVAKYLRENPDIRPLIEKRRVVRGTSSHLEYRLKNGEET